VSASQGRFGRRRRLLLGALLLLGLFVVTVYLAFPEVILRALALSARRSAGLERRSVDTAGHHIVYLDGGAGPAVVLVHGFGATKDIWDVVAAQLTPRYRVIVPDLPGFGESPVRDGETYDAERQARRVRALLDALGVRDHHIGGSSMGGLISVVYAGLYPEAVRSLLIAAAPGVRAPEKSDLSWRLEAGGNPLLVGSEADLDQLLELVFFRPPSIPGPIRRAMLHDAIDRRATYARIFKDLAGSGEGALETLLPKITARTLVVWGRHDRLVHPSSVDVFTRLMPDAEKTIFEGCGHALPRECPALLAQRYREFLERESADDDGGPGRPAARDGRHGGIQ
jgi:abhydrolase domain-containing protein 6